MSTRHELVLIWVIAAGCAVEPVETSTAQQGLVGEVPTARVLERFAPLEVMYAPSGVPIAAAVVTFEAPATGATAWFEDGAEVLTDESGVATIQPTACPIAGHYTIVARVGATTFASFTMYNLPDAPAMVHVVSGTAQRVAVDGAFEDPLVARVLDQHGNGVPGVEVTFTPPATGASATLSGTAMVTGANGAASVVTGVSGEASVMARANGLAGAYAVDVAIAGQPSTTIVLVNTDDPAVVEHPWHGLDPDAEVAR